MSLNEKPTFTVSRERHDEPWDRFLSDSPSGQFQQSSLWAQVKAAESWECARLLARRDGRHMGGAQLLFRSSRFGKIGYISKGPVLAPGAENLFLSMLEELRSLCLSLRLRAWILQPPDEALWQTPALLDAGYLPVPLMGIIDSTLVLDLSLSWDILLGNMRRSTRQSAQQAERMGIHIREGNESDVGTFFDLMLKTCRRQRTKPDPGSVLSLQELWRAFYPGGRVRLTLAESGGIPLAGLLCLVFGRRVTMWKKGWDPNPNHFHPNELLHLEAIRWAWEHHYQCCDFVGLDRGIAEAILARRSLDSRQKASRHLFNFKLGAAPKLLPSAVIYVAGPLARALYRMAGRLNVLTALLRKEEWASAGANR